MSFINRWWSAFDRLSSSLEDKGGTSVTVNKKQWIIASHFEYRNQPALCWIWKGLSSCVCHLYYLRQQWSQVSFRLQSHNHPSIVLKCSRLTHELSPPPRYSLAVCQLNFFLSVPASISRIGTNSILSILPCPWAIYFTWSCVMRCFYSVENGLLETGKKERRGNLGRRDAQRDVKRMFLVEVITLWSILLTHAMCRTSIGKAFVVPQDGSRLVNISHSELPGRA